MPSERLRRVSKTVVELRPIVAVRHLSPKMRFLVHLVLLRIQVFLYKLFRLMSGRHRWTGTLSLPTTRQRTTKEDRVIIPFPVKPPRPCSL